MGLGTITWEEIRNVPIDDWVSKKEPNPIDPSRNAMHWAHKCWKPHRTWVVYSRGGEFLQPAICKYCMEDFEKAKKMRWHSRVWDGFVAILKTKSVKKTISWRVIALILTVITAWLVTGSIAIAGSIGGIDAIFKTICYWVHEEAWERIEKKDVDEE
jgi:uncharacterized membrane protein